jgi:hypothetical protein
MACDAGFSDCNGNPADGCECATPGCCGTICQTAHNNGVGQTFFDCQSLGTYNLTQAMEACTAFTNNANQCHDLNCVGTGDSVVCNNGASSCHCWAYSGSASGRVSAASANCNCPAANDLTWD